MSITLIHSAAVVSCHTTSCPARLGSVFVSQVSVVLGRSGRGGQRPLRRAVHRCNAHSEGWRMSVEIDAAAARLLVSACFPAGALASDAIGTLENAELGR